MKKEIRLLKIFQEVRDGIKRFQLKVRESSERKREDFRRITELKRLRRVHKTDLPPYTHCQNCGEALQGMYCHCCGQYASDINESFFKLIRHYFDNSFSYDGRLWVTLKILFLRPGHLPKEYCKGRVNSYMHPFKMYMFCSFIFFFLFFTFTFDNNKLLKPSGNNQNGITIQTSDENQEQANMQYSAVHLTEQELFQRINGRLIPLFKSYAPIGMFVLMPVFALINMAAFRRRKYPYMSHLIFSINIHTILLLLLSLNILISLLFTKINFQPAIDTDIILFFGTLIYLLVATKSFYHYKWMGTLVRVVLNSMFYFFLILLLFVSLFVAGLVYLR
jgi:hypothetical protein